MRLRGGGGVQECVVGEATSVKGVVEGKASCGQRIVRELQECNL